MGVEAGLTRREVADLFWVSVSTAERAEAARSVLMKLSKSSVDRVLTAFAELDLGDPRRARRVMQTVENLASNPRASFPDAMGSEADIEGAYRLMSSRHVSMAALNEAHAEVTAKRALAAYANPSESLMLKTLVERRRPASRRPKVTSRGSVPALKRS